MQLQMNENITTIVELAACMDACLPFYNANGYT